MSNISHDGPSRIYFILGPTASGKTDLALQLVAHSPSIIINGDSLQVYKKLDIGTAKPSLVQRAQCPHYLFDCRDIGESFTAGEFRREARALIDQFIKTHRIFVVGGSGFYLQALEKGMFDAPKAPESLVVDLENRLKKEGSDSLWQNLNKLDPESAKKIHKNDSYRIMRALSVVMLTGRKWAEIHQDFLQNSESVLPFEVIKIGLSLSREELKNKVIQRTQNMLDKGLVEEVRNLLGQVSPNWAPLQSVGYKEVVEFIQQGFSPYELELKIIQNTMKLIKKQMTWFKRDKTIHWLSAEEAYEKSLDLIR